jgi:hypothetical protein
MLAVAHTVEFERVAALPRRVLTLNGAREWADYLTPLFALRDGAVLRPWQAQCLAEAVDHSGAWIALPVGQGKTLLSWLLPTAMHAERSLLLIPASLRDKTTADFKSYLDAWRAPGKPCTITTRESLAAIGGAKLLDDYAPDLIIIDESDDLSNAQSSASRRLDRYVRAHNPRVVAMSGTPARKSLLGYWHLLAWTLGDGAPVPLRHEEAQMWALAIDDHRQARPNPGPLGGTLRAAREWFRRRLVETPGVVVVDEDSCDAPLTVRVRLAREDETLDAAFERFGVEQENPGGIPVSDPLSRWLLDAQLGLGLYTRWAPAPPDAWRNARRAIARFVRERIDASTRSAQPLDTEAQVLRRHDTLPVVQNWLREKPNFNGATETIWITRSTLDSCHDWISEQTVPGIVWCGSVDFGRALAHEAKLAYYGPRGECDGGSALHAASAARSFVASWQANKKGHNLQAWTRQLIVMPPQSAKWLEQIIGRSHRAGQRERVIVDVLATSGGTLDAFETAFGEAACIRQTISLTQKLLRADIVHAQPNKTNGNAYRWARRTR